MLGRLRRVSALSSADRHLLLMVAFLLAAIPLGLRLLSLRTLRCLLTRLAQVHPRLPTLDPAYPERVAWAIRTVARYLPAATCLAQALAAQLVLERRGHPATLRIGIGRDDGARLHGHAWVESDGSVVVGGGGLWRYRPLSVFGGNEQ